MILCIMHCIFLSPHIYSSPFKLSFTVIQFMMVINVVMWEHWQCWLINGVAQYSNWYLGGWGLGQILYNKGLYEYRINTYHLQQGHMIIKSWIQLFLICTEHKHPLAISGLSMSKTEYDSYRFYTNQTIPKAFMPCELEQLTSARHCFHELRNVSSLGKIDESKLSDSSLQWLFLPSVGTDRAMSLY